MDSTDRSKLYPKSVKCNFIRYGIDQFSYQFWDDKDQKIIRSRDVIFNEKVMYKDRDKSASKSQSVTYNEHVELEEISENDLNSRIQNNPENLIPQTEPHTPTPTPKLRRSEKESKPTQRWSPSLYYLLLSDGGEPESYDEALQVDDSIKWESAMQDEMDLLMANQTQELTKLPVGKKALHNKWVYRVNTGT